MFKYDCYRFRNVYSTTLSKCASLKHTADLIYSSVANIKDMLLHTTLINIYVI